MYDVWYDGIYLFSAPDTNCKILLNYVFSDSDTHCHPVARG